MLIDLQFHSTYSDGYLTPTQLAKLMTEQGVKIAALTDHNTVSGIYEFKNACKKFGIKAITGIEIYTKLGSKSFNILWYNFDNTSPELHDILRGSQVRRRKLVRNILIKLKEKGFKLNLDKILDKYNHYVPINHVVSDFLSVPQNLARVKKELKKKRIREGDVISEYFRNPKLGNLHNSLIDLERILKLRKKIGGQIILCHPAKHSYVKADFLEKLKNLGIDGVETLSPHHSLGAILYIQFLARQFDFIETGGSDFHRAEGGTYRLQKSWDYFKIDSQYLRKIKKIIN